jgi:hypothetical protein
MGRSLHAPILIGLSGILRTWKIFVWAHARFRGLGEVAQWLKWLFLFPATWGGAPMARSANLSAFCATCPLPDVRYCSDFAFNPR